MQTNNLNVTPTGVMPRVNVSQYDNNREVHFLLFDGSASYTPPTGAEIRVEGTKKDGNGFSYECTYSGNNVTVTIKSQMTVFAGDVLCELRISKGDLDIGTLNFILGVEEGALADDVPISDTEIPAIIELAKGEQFNAEAWAQGTKDGVPVTSDDPQYHNNAKWYAEHSQGGSFANLADVDVDNPTNGQVPVYNSITEKWENQNASGGLLPHFNIHSEHGSVVTVTYPDGVTTITATETSSGLFECDVTEFGTYTIDAVLGGDDAQVHQAIDTVMIYEIHDEHFSYALSVYAPSGSTIRVSATGESYTGTGAGSTATVFALHQASTTYTVQVTIDGQSKTDTITSSSTTGGSGSVTISFGTINVAYDDDFRGETVTCTLGGTTITKTAPSIGNIMAFYPPTTGTWVIASGQYSVNAIVASLSTAVSVQLQSVPEGSTVTPTDDIQTWLACAGITDKSYTTLNEVLADSTTLLALISDDNASDYLVRSTTWASGITADSTAMTDIGANNYCADTLLADSTWLTAIANSSYIESVLNVEVPLMTSNTTPSGVASCSSYITTDGTNAYKAFDKNNPSGNSMDLWATDTLPAWIAYKFTSSINVKVVYFENRDFSSDGNRRIKTYKVQASNDDFVSDVHDLTDSITRDNSKNVAKGADTVCLADNNDNYSSYRLYITERFAEVGNQVGCAILQFYGRVDV